MIDRISRTDYTLPMYRQTFSNELETHRIYEERNPSATFSNGRVIGSPQYPQTALDYSLTHAVEGTDRVHYMYNNLGEEYKSNTVDPTGTPYAGNNINILV